MSKLSDLYKARKTLVEAGIVFSKEQEAELDRLEEETVRKEVVPVVNKLLMPALKGIEREMTLVLDYHPGNGIDVRIKKDAGDYASNISLSDKNVVEELEFVQKLAKPAKKYSIDNVNFFNKKNFAFIIMKHIVEHFSEKPFDFFASMFPRQKGFNIILLKEEDWLKKTDDGKSRYYCKKGEGFYDCNGVKFFLTTQWTGELIEELVVPIAEDEFGYTIYRKY